MPPEPTLDNFVRAWSSNHFGQYFLNSALVASTSVGLILLLGSMMAHSLVRYRFLGRRLVLAAIVFLMIMPAMSLLVPQFVLASRLGVTNSLAGLVMVDVAQGLPLATFILYGFLRDLPGELYEAATVDGAGRSLYRRISIPLGRSALATAGSSRSLDRGTSTSGLRPPSTPRLAHPPGGHRRVPGRPCVGLGTHPRSVTHRGDPGHRRVRAAPATRGQGPDRGRPQGIGQA